MICLNLAGLLTYFMLFGLPITIEFFQCEQWLSRKQHPCVQGTRNFWFKLTVAGTVPDFPKIRSKKWEIREVLIRLLHISYVYFRTLNHWIPF